MPLDSKQRRALTAQGNRLRPGAVIGADELSEATVAHVRQCFARGPLIKIRIQTEDRRRCDAVIAELAERVPCELVRRLGRVALFYRSQDESSVNA